MQKLTFPLYYLTHDASYNVFKNLVGQVLAGEKIWVGKNVSSEFFLVHKFLGQLFFWVRIDFDKKKIRFKKEFGSKFFLGQTISWVTKNLG